MKQIIGNKYINVYKFLSAKEKSFFLANQETMNILSLDETFGDNYFCYVCYHSLTSEKQFVISFGSDKNEDELSFLFWEEHKMFALDTGKKVYLINNKLKIISSYEITTPLIGLFLANKDNLLLLEEASFRLVDFEGETIKNEWFDLIENFSIENDKLSIHTSEGNKIFELI